MFVCKREREREQQQEQHSTLLVPHCRGEGEKYAAEEEGMGWKLDKGAEAGQGEAGGGRRVLTGVVQRVHLVEEAVVGFSFIQ